MWRPFSLACIVDSFSAESMDRKKGGRSASLRESHSRFLFKTALLRRAPLTFQRMESESNYYSTRPYQEGMSCISPSESRPWLPRSCGCENLLTNPSSASKRYVKFLYRFIRGISESLNSLGVVFPAACREFVIPAKAGIQKIRLDSVSSTE
jgi:hypothetical protein